MTPAELAWSRPFGARPLGDGCTEFRVWAPLPGEVLLRAGRREHAMADAGHGVYEATLPVGPGERYEYLLDRVPHPDPCSRLQPDGIRAASEVVDPSAFVWTDERWGGVPLSDLVIYELHVGTFTQAGTFDAALEHLPALRELGITALELLPVAAGPGERGWGYDGTHLWATHSAYGGPAGLQRLVDAAHAAGLAVLMDCVYNHVGASGAASLAAFGPYFSSSYGTFWGQAINYDGADCDPVREWAIQGACAWVRDFHLDGLRLDAIHSIHDSGAHHVLEELVARVRREDPRSVLIAEANLNDPKVTRPREVGGYGFAAEWADDFHHALRTLVTTEHDGYYAEFGRVEQLAKAFRRPFVHDGTWSEFRRRRHGAPAFDRAPEQFVVFAQNHDQVGNRAFGDRMPADARPLAALLTLLAPFVPMLFMGEEYGEGNPFLFFTDHIDPDIAQATRVGRRREMSAFAAWSEEDVPDPQDPETFRRSKLSRRGDPALQALYAELLKLRRELGHGEAAAEFDESARWLRVARGGHTIVANFAREQRRVAVSGSELRLATHADVRLEADELALPGLSGAVVL